MGGAEATWGKTLAAFDADLRARGMSEKTRHAYGVDLGQLAEWAAAQDLGPIELDSRWLRRFAGVLSERGARKSTVARKLAAIRTFYRQLVQRGELEANPADLVASPKRESYLPQVLKAAEIVTLLERIPAGSPLDLRDRAMFELAYSAGLRVEEIVTLDLQALDPDAEEVRVEGKGSKTRVVPVGEPAWRAMRAYLERGRSALVSAAAGAGPAVVGAGARSCPPPPVPSRRCSCPRTAGGSPPPTCAAVCGSLYDARPSRAAS